ncbi:hypothetical protein D3C73_712480 [compost metagenome]
MQRCKIEQLADLGLRIGINQCGSLEKFAAVNYAVSNSIDLVDRRDHTVLLVSQTGQHFADRCIVFKNFADFRNFLLPGRLMVQNGGIHPDALYQTFGKYGFIGHIVQLVL